MKFSIFTTSLKQNKKINDLMKKVGLFGIEPKSLYLEYNAYLQALIPSRP
jgi:hypothetical protein